MSPVRDVGGAARLVVKAKPRASREGLSEKDGELVVSVNAAPVDGEATARVVEVVARALAVKKNQVIVVRGETSRHKELEVRGVSVAELAERLARALGA